MAGAAGIDSDDFSGATFPSAFWTELNTGGAGSWAQIGYGGADVWARGTVTAADFTYYGDVDGVALVQPCTGDTDFVIECKFANLPSATGEECAIFCHDTGTTGAAVGMTIGYYHSSGNVRLWWGDGPAGSFLGNIQSDDSYLRLGYTASTDLWEGWSSADGAAWTPRWTGGSGRTLDNVGWSDPHVGVIVNNGGSTAHSVDVDYFWETSDPISPEDPTATVRRVMVR